MTEETSPAPSSTPAGVIEHWCQHPGCKRWGSFGYSTGKGEPRWFCGEHRVAGEQ